MKKIFLSIFAVVTTLAACNTEPKGVEAEVKQVNENTDAAIPEGEPWNMQAGSIASFYGATPTHGQNGEFPISEGALYVKDGQITGGKAVFNLEDMVITTDGLEDEKKVKFKSHLLSEDFFNTPQYPTVTFTITDLAPLTGDTNATHTVSGNLAMHGNTNLISFPAKVTMADSSISANATFVINRKDWGMSYKNDESLGDEWIYDKVEMKINLTAKK